MHSDFYQEEELKGSLSNFEQSLKYDEVKYFEIFEFEFIIDHYIISGDVENSRKAIQRALIIHPKSHEIQKRLAQVKNIEGFFEDAVRILEESFLSFGTEKDIEQLDTLLHGLKSLKNKTVCLQPISQKAKATALCMQTCIERNWRLSVQVHKYLDID